MELDWHASDLEVACTQSRARPSLLNPVPNKMLYIVSKLKEGSKSILETLFYEFISLPSHMASESTKICSVSSYHLHELPQNCYIKYAVCPRVKTVTVTPQRRIKSTPPKTPG